MTAKGQLRYAFPAYKVYIFGLDVSNDVLDIEINYNTGKAPNTCKLTLANDLDKYVCTTEDLTILLGPKVKAAAEEKLKGKVASNELTELFIDEAILAAAETIQPETKRRVIRNKIVVRIPNVEQPNVNNQLNTGVKTLTASAYRYPIQAEDPIFHANDPIRVFMRHPFDPKRWYHAFCGYLSNFDDNTDENNQKLLTIGAEGPSKILRYARITTNPGIVDMKAIVQAEIDAAEREMYTAGFRNLTLPEVLFAIIFGNDPQHKYNGKFTVNGTDADGNAVTSQLRLRGVGNFNFNRSACIEYGPAEPATAKSSVPTISVTKLSEYQSIIDHEVKLSDLTVMLAESVSDGDRAYVNMLDIPKYADGSPDIGKVIDFIGRRTDYYPVDSGALIVLTPACFLQAINRNILTKDIIDSVAMNTTFKSRLGMIYDIIDRIEFVFYESPRGDLICEFPLYDFDPDDFGVDAVSNAFIVAASPETRKVNVDKTTTRGPFGPSWVLWKGDIYNYARGMTDEKVRTQIVSPWYPVQNYDGIGNNAEFQGPAVVTLRHLVPLYWLRLEQANPKGWVGSKEGAYTFCPYDTE